MNEISGLSKVSLRSFWKGIEFYKPLTYSTPLVLLIGFVVLSPLYGWTLWRVAGLPVLRPDLIISGAIILYSGWRMVQDKELHINRTGLILLVLLTLTTISNIYEAVLNPNQVVDMTTTYIQFLLIVSLYISFSNLDLSLSEIRILLKVWILSATGIAVFGIYQGIARIYSLPLERLVFNIPAPGTIQRVGYTSTFPDLFRVASVFAEPSWYGTYLIPPAIITLFSVVFHKRQSILFKKRITASFVFIILLFGILQSASVLSYLTFCLSLVIYVIPVLVRQQIIGIDKILAFGFASTIGVLIVPTLRQTILKIADLPSQLITWIITGDINVLNVASAEYRLRIMLHTIELWSNQSVLQKIIGIGLNSLENNPQIPFESTPGAYSQILIDQGILGFVLFAIFLFSMLKETYHVGNKPGNKAGNSPSSATRFVSLALSGVIASTIIMFGQIGHMIPLRWTGILVATAFVTTIRNSSNSTLKLK